MYTWKSFAVVQADYQHWANEVLFASLDHLRPEFLESDEGLFFKSIHHTVDHILVVSSFWRQRLQGSSPSSPDFKAIQHPDWRELKNALRHETRQLQSWLEARDDAWFDSEIFFTRDDGSRHRMWARDVLNHLFTHYAHHRGQVSAVATRLGAPCPEMDYLYYRREMEKVLSEARHAPGG